MLSGNGVSVYDVFELSIGPSRCFSNGALKIGSILRELINQIELSDNTRLIIVLQGELSRQPKALGIEKAITAGLSGYQPGESVIPLYEYYEKTRKAGGIQFLSQVLPFNPESDIIRGRQEEQGTKSAASVLVQISTGSEKIIFNESFLIDPWGRVSGPGISVSPLEPLDNEYLLIKNLERVLHQNQLKLYMFFCEAEAARLRKSTSQLNERLLFAWRIMEVTLNNSLLADQNNKIARPSKSKNYAERHKEHLFTATRFVPDISKTIWQSYGITEGAINQIPMVTAPGSLFAGVLPSVFGHLKEKFRLSEDRIVHGLLTAAYFCQWMSENRQDMFNNNPLAAEAIAVLVMTSAGALACLDFEFEVIRKSVSLSLMRSGRLAPEKTIDQEIAYAPIQAMHLTMGVFEIMDLAQIMDSDDLPHPDKILRSF